MYLRIRGEIPLQGDVNISGSKNAALPQFAATLLSSEKSILKNVPDLSDISLWVKLFLNSGPMLTN